MQGNQRGRITLEDCAQIRRVTPRRPSLDGISSSLNILSSPPLYEGESNKHRKFSLPSQYKYQSDSPKSEQSSSPTTRLRPAYFTPQHHTGGSSTSQSTVSSLTPTRPTPTPIPTPAPVVLMSSRDAPRPVPLFYGNYRENEEPTTWFAQFQLSLPDNYTDAKRLQRFEMQLAPGHIADQWFASLTPSNIASFAALRLAFSQRWPPPRPPAYSRAQQKERVMAQVLKEEDIGVWMADGATGNYGHVVWAHKVMRLALGMGDIAGFLIEPALENIPNMLKDHLLCSYSTWQEFVDDVESVPAIKLKRAREELDKERLRDADIARLKAQSASPSALSLQLSQLSLDTARPTYRSTLRNPIPSAPSFNYMPAPSNRPLPPRGAGLRGSMFMNRPALSRTQILEKLSTVPHHPNTEAGRRQYEMDVELWHRMHGAEGIPSLDYPYPLRPGTAEIGSGECYNCGMTTDPIHFSSQCVSNEPIRTHESRWRQYIAALLRRTASPAMGLPRPAYMPTPVQHVMPVAHPYYQAYGPSHPSSVFAVMPQEDASWWEQQNGWGYQDLGYEWGPENCEGPPSMADQQ